VTPATESGSEEIGWQEFDDLSQLDGSTEEREYTFEEADAATLAELGLNPEELAALQASPEGAAEEGPKPARRRSTRAKKDEAPVDDAVADEAAPEEAPKPARRRSTRAKKDEAPAAEAVEVVEPAEDAPKPARRRSTRAKADEGSTTAPDEPKPARRRSSRATKDADASPSAGDEGETGEPQGIWGRFRTARKPRGTSSG